MNNSISPILFPYRTGAIAFIIALTFTCVSSAQAIERIYPIFPASQPIELDGRLSDPAWELAPWSGTLLPLKQFDGQISPSQFKALYDTSGLFLAIEAFEPHMENIIAVLDDGDAVWRDDSFEIFLESSAHDRGYFRTGVNIAGKRSDLRTVAAATRDQEHFYLEIHIPWSILQASPDQNRVIRANICRNQNTRGKDWGTWSPLEASFHEPSHFGAFYLQPNSVSPEKVQQIERYTNLVFVTTIASAAQEMHQKYQELVDRAERTSLPNDQAKQLVAQWRQRAEDGGRYVAYFQYFREKKHDPDFWSKDHSQITDLGPCPSALTFLKMPKLTEAEDDLLMHIQLLELFNE